MLQLKRHVILIFISLALLWGDISSGDQVPQLIFRSLSGKLIFVNDYVGEARMLNASGQRVPLLLVFFRSDDASVKTWLPALSDESKKAKLKTFFIAVDESGDDINSFRKSAGIRGSFLFDKYGSAAEQLDLLPLHRFSSAPTAVLVQKNGDIYKVFSNFRANTVSHILDEAKTNAENVEF